MGSQRSHVTITSDGRVIVTDNWAATGLHKLSKTVAHTVNPKLTVQSQQFSADTPIGIVDYGILHGEEPEISGQTGTGAIYIHGCPLKCATCYQPEFFSSQAKSYTNQTALTQLMLDFQRAGVETVSLVIATYRADVHQAIKQAKQQGLSVPVAYNYSGMLTPRVLATLLDDVDIFMPDMKAVSRELVRLHHLPEGYSAIATDGIRFLLDKGAEVIVRHLVVPDFSNAFSEVEALVEKLNLSASQAVLSLLIHYMDPATKSISSVKPDLLNAFEKMAQEKHVKLYFQGGYA